MTELSDTPETDNLARGNHVVPTEWAEQLEKECNEARHEIEGWRNKWECAVVMAARAEIERDEAQEKNARFREIISRANRDYDEQIELFRSEVNKLRDIAERAIEMKEQEVWGRSAFSFSWKQLRAELDQIKEGVE
jgi:hypothetical protein